MSKDKDLKNFHKTSVGGEALIEGIMMRGPRGDAIAVRMPDKTIKIEKNERTLWRDKYKLLGLPVIRGIVGFVESLTTGYKYLLRSAELSTEGLEDDSQDMNKLEKWLSDHLGDKIVGVVGILGTIIGFALAFFLFMWLPSFLVDILRKGALPQLKPLFEGLIRMVIFIGYLYLVSLKKDIKRVFQYHGAEHKTIACYEYGLPLTVENVKKQVRFHPRCGTSFTIIMIVLSIFVSSILVLIFPVLANINRALWIFIKLLILPLVMGLGYEFIRYAGRHNNVFSKALSAPGLWLQRITTKEPTDDIIECGIESLKAVITDNPEDDAL